MKSIGLPELHSRRSNAAVGFGRSGHAPLQVVGSSVAAASYDIGWRDNQQEPMAEFEHHTAHALSHNQTQLLGKQPMALRQTPAVSQHLSPAKIMRGIKSCTTIWHLQQHMQNLPPDRLNHLHRAAALVHAAQTQLRTTQPLSEQDGEWLRHLTRLATSPECMVQHQPRQLSSIMWAIARLQLLEPCQQAFNTVSAEQDICYIWDSLIYQLHAKTLSTLASQHSSHTVQNATQQYSMMPSDAVMALQAIAICSHQHDHDIVGTLLQYLEPHVEFLTARDLATFAHAVASLKAANRQSLLTDLVVRASSELPAMSVQQVATITWALPELLSCSDVSIYTKCLASQQQQANSMPAQTSDASAAALEAALQQLRSQLLGYLAAGLPAGLPSKDTAAMLWGLSKLKWDPGPDVMQRLLAAASMSASQHNSASKQHVMTTVGDIHGTQLAAHGDNGHSETQTDHHHQVVSEVSLLTQLTDDSKDHVPALKLPSNTSSRAAANAVTAAARLNALVPVDWLEAALGDAVQTQQGVQTDAGSESSEKRLQDIGALLSAAAKSGVSPAPAVMDQALLAAANAGTATTSISQNLQLVTPIVWSLAKLKYIVDARLLHRILATAMQWNLQDAMQRFQQQQQAAHPLAANDTSGSITQHVKDIDNSASMPGQSASVSLSCLSQLLWSVAVLLETDRQQQGAIEPGIAASSSPNGVKPPVQNTWQQQQQSPAPPPSQQQQTAVPHSHTADPLGSVRRRLDLHPLLLHDLLMLTDQSLQTSDTQQIAKHLPQLVWALASLAKTTQRQLSLALRRTLMQAVARSVITMDARGIAVCMSALRDCGCHRRLDSYGMSSAVMGRILSTESNLVSSMQPWEVLACYHGLSELGYVLKTKHLISAMAAAVSNKSLWTSQNAKVLLKFVSELSMLGLDQYGTLVQSDVSSCQANTAARKQFGIKTVHTFKQQCVSSLFRSKALARFNMQDIVQLVELCTTLRLQPTYNQWKQLLGHIMLITTGSYTPTAKKPKDASNIQTHLGSTRRNPKPVTSKQCTAVLYALARYESCMAASGAGAICSGLLCYGLPLKAWMKEMLQFIMGDLPSLAPVDIARLLASLTRLQCYNAHWLRVLNLQLEVRSAVLSKADHALIQQAWTQLGAGKSPKSQRVAQAKQTEVTNFDDDVSL